MRYSYSIIAMLLASSMAFSQGLLLEENFDYAAGVPLRDHGWTPHSAGGTNPLQTGTTPLSLPNTPYVGNGIGVSALVNNTGSDENKPFLSSVDTGSVYAAFLVKAGGEVTSSGTGFFFHLVTYSDPANPDFTSISTAFRARTFITTGSDAGSFRLGLNFNAAAVPSNVGVDVTSDLDTAETYLVVVKYTFISGPDNDEVSLFVFENGDPISTEPATPTLGPYGGTAGDAPILQAVALRQYNSEQNIIVDGINVRTDWDFEDLSNISATSPLSSLEVSVYPNPATTGVLHFKAPIAAPLTVTLRDVTGKIVLEEQTQQSINVSHLNAGVYLATILQNGRLSTQKVVIQ
ncbi:MAG: T9SS type A sorting domain-containing protein [Schleiferiaceae bacterium]|nr:T9SS type A sorting domain-containing protein [Schleiferiaceae bacterium]